MQVTQERACWLCCCMRSAAQEISEPLLPKARRIPEKNCSIHAWYSVPHTSAAGCCQTNNSGGLMVSASIQFLQPWFNECGREYSEVKRYIPRLI